MYILYACTCRLYRTDLGTYCVNRLPSPLLLLSPRALTVISDFSTDGFVGR